MPYSALGVLGGEIAAQGLAAGWLSRRWLSWISTTGFRRFAVAGMFASGSLLLRQQRRVLLALFAPM